MYIRGVQKQWTSFERTLNFFGVFYTKPYTDDDGGADSGPGYHGRTGPRHNGGAHPGSTIAYALTSRGRDD